MRAIARGMATLTFCWPFSVTRMRRMRPRVPGGGGGSAIGGVGGGGGLGPRGRSSMSPSARRSRNACSTSILPSASSFRTCLPSSLGTSAPSASGIERGRGVIDAELATRETLEHRAHLFARRQVHGLCPLDVRRRGFVGHGLLSLRFVRCRRAGAADREIAAHGLHADVAVAAADGDAVFVAAAPHDTRGQLALDVAARRAVIDRGVGLGERQLDIAADRLEAMFLLRIETPFDLDVAAHGVELARAQPSRGDRDVAAHGVPLEMPDVTPAIDVAAHRLQPHRSLHILDPDVARDRLDLDRSTNALDRQFTAYGLRIDRAFGRHRDVEVDAEALAAEEVEPAALLLVEVRLHEKLVTALLHAHLEVLQQPLRAVLAARAHALARDDSDLAGRARRGDGRLAGDVPNAQPRRLLERESLLDGLGVALAADIADEVTDERARELTWIEVAAVYLETTGRRSEFDAVGHVLRPPRRVIGMARFTLRIALGATGLTLRATRLVPSGVVRLTGRPPVGIAALVAQLVGSLSSRFAASSAAMRPSASSRRISLRRSLSRSGSACEGKPSARIIASRRERTVGYEMPSSRSMSLKLPRARMKVSRNSTWSPDRAWKRPSENEPSIRVPQLSHSRRTTLSCSEQMGHFATTGFAMHRRCDST